MFFAAPLPDEFHPSYLGRLVDLNGLPKDRVKLMEFLRAKVPKDYIVGGAEPHTIEILAFAASMSLPDFVRKHTLLPYRRAVASHKEKLLHGDPNDRPMLRISAPQVAREGAYFCSSCTNDDHRQFGMSYWRRSHQIPGLFVCPVHGVALRYVETEEGFWSAPSRAESTSHSIDEEWALQSYENPLVRRFIELSLALAGSDKPLQIKPLREMLVQRARHQGFSIYSTASKNLLSDSIVERFPRQWLEAIFPGITSKLPGEVLNQIDGVLFLSTCSSSAAAYLLAIASLYDSTEQALAALGTVNSTEKRPSPRVANTRADLGIEALRAGYIEVMGNHAALARKHKQPVVRLSQQLRNLGLPNLTLAGNRQGSLVDAAFNFFSLGLSIAESATRANVRVTDVERIARYAGADLIAALKQISPVPVTSASKANARLGTGQLPHRMGFALRPIDSSDHSA